MSALLAYDPDLLSLTACAVGIYVVTSLLWKYVEARRSPLNDIPTVGYSGVLTSYITAFKYIISGRELIQEGYDRYPNQAFKIANLSKWHVIVSGRKLLDDVRHAPEDELSFKDAIADFTQTKYTMGAEVEDDPYHVAIVPSSITRNLVVRFEDIKDEIMEAFTDYIPPNESWVSVPAYETIMHIVCRTSNRYFVGLPLCRDPGYRSLNETFTIDVAVSARIINCFPDFLKPLVGMLSRTRSRGIKRALAYLGPTIRERLIQEEKHGQDWPGKPNDVISWLLNVAKGDQRTVEGIALRIIAINFAAIHTSSMTFTQILYDLAIHPEYVKEMREEVEEIIQEWGWTKAAMQKMRKVDSFLRESQRLNGLGSLIMTRKALKDWTLSDGTRIPTGTYISIANDPMHKDEAYFPDAHTFKAFRFSDLRDGDGELDSIKHQVVALNFDQLIFGHGRHACPGRFFAINELKAMFAYILLTYDVQLEGGSLERPRTPAFEYMIIANTKAKVMFRKRTAA